MDDIKRATFCIIKNPQNPRRSLQDMTAAQGSARDHAEAEWLEATEVIPGRPTANISQKKGNKGARQVEQSSVRYRQ
jgi:hypothetical protein